MAKTGAQYFKYGKKEIEHLKSRDPILGEAIDKIGRLRREVRPDIFSALINSIIGQQISSKAQATVWARFKERFNPMTPELIALAAEADLQACGISFKKAAYVKDIARAVHVGDLDLIDLQKQSDAEVCKRLSQLKGIGVWTAEMLMIFSMQRPDIISMGDLAIIRGLKKLYRHRKITPQLFAKYKRRYSPYATVASLYLWEISSEDF